MNASIQDRFKRFAARGLCLLTDDSVPDGRTVVVASARDITPQLMNQSLNISSALSIVAISPARREALMLEYMTRGLQHSSDAEVHKMCISVEAREGVTTGISAFDRARTCNLIGADPPLARQLVRPGHIFPLEVREGGVLVRFALTEGAWDLVRIVQRGDAALCVDLLDRSGNFSSTPERDRVSAEFELPILTLSEIARYRLEHENLVHKVAEAKLPTRIAGEFRSIVYRTTLHGGEHMVLIKGALDLTRPVLTRVQPEFTCADVFGGDTPPSRSQLHNSMRALADHGSGILIYLRRPQTGHLRNQINNWQTEFSRKPAVMMREYGIGAQILRDLGVKSIELLTSSSKTLSGLTNFGIEIVAQRPIPQYQEAA
ncbi:MAG: 3,4-dihydroxy-2-butanone-4-phosphate synthase [Oligoflexia bacterium]|nr:3,4-dihydroxy-2-butanone-4-phosphate synthase [Oligoflexia bacterium]